MCRFVLRFDPFIWRFSVNIYKKVYEFGLGWQYSGNIEDGGGLMSICLIVDQLLLDYRKYFVTGIRISKQMLIQNFVYIQIYFSNQNTFTFEPFY